MMVAHTYATHVAWADTDASGRIHFTAPLRWAEAAEHDLLRRHDLGYATRLVRVKVAAEYLAPLVFEDAISIEIQVRNVGRTSVSFSWHALHDEAVCIRGEHTAVFVSPNGRPCVLPDDLRTVLSSFVPQVSRRGG